MSAIAYAGIDVAVAHKKRLPVCVVIREGRRLVPLPLKQSGIRKPPEGCGNRAALDPTEVSLFAANAVSFLEEVESHFECRIETVAIDAPSSPCRDDLSRRVAEVAMDKLNYSCIPTPNRAKFEEKRQAALHHLEAGHPLARLPNANQFWMFIGFALFEALSPKRRCLEVYPHAIIRTLGVEAEHKTKKEGYGAQVRAAAAATGNDEAALDVELRRCVYGARHDRLDAFLSAWVAATPDHQLVAHGDPPDDVIWCPTAAARYGG